MTIRCRVPFATIVALLVLVASAPAQQPKVIEPPKTFDVKAIDEYVARKVVDQGFVGLSLAIMREGKLVLARGYGKKSLAGSAAVTPETQFAIGSVTKQFTCACVLLLAEEGKLSVHDKVAKFFPDLTRAKDITLYDLMTHVSGYPDYYPLDFVDQRMEKTIVMDELLREYAGAKLDFEPGTRWSYSNTGFILLGRIVEKVAGESFDRFLTRRILKPIGMEHSIFEPREPDERLAQGHTTFALGDPEPAQREGDGWIHAAGGLYTSAADLARWDLALMNGKVLKPESFNVMKTPRTLADGRTKNYGCGLNIVQRDGDTILRHSGAVSGFLAHNAMVPRTKSAVVLLGNGDHVDPATLHGEILSLLLKDLAGKQPDVPIVQGPPPKEVGLELLHQMQKGAIDRAKLGKHFNIYLSEERVQKAASRLKALGEPTKIDVEGVSERGGMEVAQIRFTFKSIAVKALLYRTPDGKVQEFLLFKG